MAKVRFKPDNHKNQPRDDIGMALAISIAPRIEEKVQILLQQAGKSAKVSVTPGPLGNFNIEIVPESGSGAPATPELFSENSADLGQGKVDFKDMDVLGEDTMTTGIDKIIQSALDEVMETLPSLIADLENQK